MELVSSGDIVFAARIVNYSVGMNAVVSSHYPDGAALTAKLRARLEDEVFATGRNIIEEEGRWGLHPLYVAGDKPANTNYLMKILTDPDGVAKFLERYVRDRFGEPSMSVDALSELVDLPVFTLFVAGVNLPADAAGPLLAQKVLITRCLREAWAPNTS